MDRDDLIDLFSVFGPVSVRRMFSGFGISVDGVTFALALRAGVFLRAEPATEARFAAEGCQPFQYTTRLKTVTVRSYWQLPERLYDDPDELAQWARMALASAEKAALAKRSRVPRSKTGVAVKNGGSGKAAKAAKTSKAAKAAKTRKTAKAVKASKTAQAKSASRPPRQSRSAKDSGAGPAARTRK